MSEIEPNEAAIGEIRAALDNYETARDVAHRRLRILVPLALVPAGLLAIYGLWNLVLSSELPFGGDDRMGFAFNTLLVVVILAAGGIWLAHGPARRLQQSLRDRLLPSLFGFIGDVEYSHGSTPFTFDYLPKAALPSHTSREFGDVLRGRHDFMRFELFELRLLDRGRKSDKTVFDGVALAFDIPTAFDGVLLATPRVGAVAGLLRFLFAAPLSTIETGDELLDVAFEFRTDNPRDAHALVTGPLAKALAAARRDWGDGPPRLALAGQVGFLLMPGTKDFFELPPVETAIDYDLHVQPMLGDLSRLLATAAHVRRAMAGKEGEREAPGLLN